MHRKHFAAVLLKGCLLFFACAAPVTRESRIAAYEAEIRTATIEEKTVPILLGIHPGARLPSVLKNLAPDMEEGLVYWEWIEISGGGEKRQVIKTAYGELRPGGMDFPFAKELDVSKIYMGIGIHLTFLYKKPTGEWVHRLILPGILSRRPPQEKFNLKRTGALRYADENIRLIDVELIPPTRRAAYIAHAFEMILVP